MKQYFRDSVAREYTESSKDVRTYLNVHDANRKTRQMFEPMIAHYAPYPQYRTFDSYDENQCLTRVISCTQGEEPLGRRWKSVVATELRAETHIETLARKNSFKKRDPESEDDDSKKHDDSPSERFRTKFKSGYQSFMKHMCMGANGHQAEADREHHLDEFQLGDKSSFDYDIREFLSRMLDTTGLKTFRDPRLLTHSSVYINALRRSLKSDHRFVGALLRYYANYNNMKTTTFPVLRPNTSDSLDTCTLGLLISTGGSNPFTTFTAIHKEKFTQRPSTAANPPSSRRSSSNAVDSEGRITKRRASQFSGKNSRWSNSRNKHDKYSQFQNRYSTSFENDVDVEDTAELVKRHGIMSKRARKHREGILLRRKLQEEEERQVLVLRSQNQEQNEAQQLLSPISFSIANHGGRRDSRVSVDYSGGSSPKQPLIRAYAIQGDEIVGDALWDSGVEL